MRRCVVGCTAVLALVAGADAARADRLLYASDWLGPTQIFALDPTGRKPLAQVTFHREATCLGAPIACGWTDPLPSPDGRRIIFKGAGEAPGGALWMVGGDGSHLRLLAFGTGRPEWDAAAWSSDSRQVAIAGALQLVVLSRDGSDRRTIRLAGNFASSVSWAPDGRRIAITRDNTLAIVDVAAGTVRSLGVPGVHVRWAPTGDALALQSGSFGTEGIALIDATTGFGTTIAKAGAAPEWSPDGRYVAYAAPSAIALYDTRTGATRQLTSERGFDLAWSPDGLSLAYVQGHAEFDTLDAGDIRQVSLATGEVRTLVSADGEFGGQISGIAWSRTPQRHTTYKRPVTPDGWFGGGPVARLAADGPVVAYSSCLHVYVRADRAVEVRGPTGYPGCLPLNSREAVYDLGLAGDRVAWGEKTPGLIFSWVLRLASTRTPPIEMASGYTALGDAARMDGALQGEGSLLVFSARRYEIFGGPVTERLLRTEPDGCCTEISSSVYPNTPLDVNARRIVVRRSTTIDVLDDTGRVLLSVPGRPSAAQLDGSMLVLLEPGTIRVVDAMDGALLRSLALPDVATGRDCTYYSEHDCPRDPTIVLQDVRFGLAAYTLLGRVHVIRIADGRDAEVGWGSEARFFDGGLVYADGARLHVVSPQRLSELVAVSH